MFTIQSNTINTVDDKPDQRDTIFKKIYFSQILDMVSVENDILTLKPCVYFSCECVNKIKIGLTCLLERI